MATRRLLPVLACLALLAGCGFQLRGSAGLPADLGGVYLAMPDELSPVAVELRRRLEAGGPRLAPNAAAADAVVRVRIDRTGRRVLAVSARNTPTEFEIFYVLEYSIDRGGQQVVPPQRLELTRNFSFDERDLLAKEHEEDVLREALASDLADLVLRRLESLPPAPPPVPAQTGPSR
jgi:LPS-assembly lipoprotein